MRAHIMPYWGNHKGLGLIAGIVMGLLCATLLFLPGLIHWLVQVESGAGTDVMSNRAAILFLGLSVLAFRSRAEAPSPLRNTIDLSLGLVMAGLLVVGLYHYVTGQVSHGIWLALGVEAFFASAYLRFWRGGADLA